MTMEMASIFSALGDPTRLAIIERLSRGDASVLELSEPFDISAPAISRHLKVLEQAGLISRSRSGQVRPCKLELSRMKDIEDWTQRMRQFWDESFDRMDAYLADIMKNKGEGK